MSDVIKRYSIEQGTEYHHASTMDEDPDGDWISYDDHAAEVERLTQERDAARAELAEVRRDRDDEAEKRDGLIPLYSNALDDAERLEAEVERLRAELAAIARETLERLTPDDLLERSEKEAGK